MNTTENALANSSEPVAVADIRRELFEGDNIVIDHKNSDHGLSQLTKEEKIVELEPITEGSEDSSKSPSKDKLEEVD